MKNKRLAFGLVAIGAVSTVALWWFRQGEPTSERLVKVRVGYIPITECAHLYVGIAKQYFEDEGIHLELQAMKGGAAILPAVQEGSLDIGFANVVSLIALDSKLKPESPAYLLSLIGASYERPKHRNHALLVRSGSAIKPIDLTRPDCRIAINTTRNIEELTLRRYLTKHGSPEATLQIVPIGFPEMLRALEHEQVDVASVVEPFIEPAVRTGKFKILDEQYLSVSGDTLVATYATTRKWISENEKVMRALRRAFLRADEFIKNHDAECREILGSFTNIQREDLSIIGMPAFEPNATVEPFRVLTTEMLRYGFIDTAPESATLIYPE